VFFDMFFNGVVIIIWLMPVAVLLGRLCKFLLNASLRSRIRTRAPTMLQFPSLEEKQ
jgi:hypothetical protein